MLRVLNSKIVTAQSHFLKASAVGLGDMLQEYLFLVKHKAFVYAIACLELDKAMDLSWEPHHLGGAFVLREQLGQLADDFRNASLVGII